MICPAIIYLGRTSPPGSGSLPGTYLLAKEETSSLPRLLIGFNQQATILLSLFGLAPGGGCLAARIATDAGGLLHWQALTACQANFRPPTFSPLLGLKIQAVCFCGPIRQVSPPRVLPGAVLSGVRTFLDLINNEAAITRPT